jgi:enhancer of polycomb-like protein
VISDKEAKLLLKGDDELILAVYDYWIDKRLRLKQSLIPTVKSDKRDLVRKVDVFLTKLEYGFV